MSSYVVQDLVIGDTADFTLYAKKDGVIWDITGAEVLLYFRMPGGEVTEYVTATVSDGPAGKAHYQCAITLLAFAGDWHRKWKVTKVGVVVWSEWIRFTVEE